ncbi:MAG: succinylglutamate-semialdehyde dehydrogenase [Parachlamydiales bacterium]
MPILSKAKKALWMWQETPFEERCAIARAYASEIEKEDSLPHLIAEEVGKPLWEAEEEVKAMIAKIPLSIEALKERAGTLSRPGITIRHRPHGILGVLGPFNFPGHLPSGHIVPALLAGNTVVFKPSEHTPRVGARIGELWSQAGLPEGVLTILQGGPEVGRELATHPDLNGLLFTGSAKTGLALSEHYGKHPDKILALEMGGNNPLIVEDPIDKAVEITLKSAYLTAGQRCTCARRLILIDSPKANSFLDSLLEAIDRFEIAPLINAQAADRVLAFQQGLLSQGALPLKPASKRNSRTLSPGLVDATPCPSRPDEECFGPLLQLIRVPTLEAAVAEAGSTRFGLSASLLSDSPESFAYVWKRLRVGVCNWNAPTTGASSAAPFGGVGFSGNHRPTGYYAADTCAYPQVSKECPS